ncbi:MAG: hypothetical protein ACLVL2_02290 [Bacteroides cellulosilyticus]
MVSFNLEHFGKNVSTYSIKLPKVALALQALQADIYALVEVEGAAGLEELCQLLNRNCNTQNTRHAIIKTTCRAWPVSSTIAMQLPPWAPSV